MPVAQSRESLIKVHPVKTPESVAQRGRSSESNSHTQQPIETTARSNKAQLRARVEQLRKSTTTSNEDQPKAHELTPEKVVQSPAISKVGEREPADKKQASRRAVEDLKRDYVESYIMPHVTEQKKIADRAEQGTDRPQTVQAPSTKPENLVLSADIAAQAFNADIERALRFQELAQALKDKDTTQTEWANFDPKSLALQSIDYSLQRTAVKKAVITAVEIGEEQDNPDGVITIEGSICGARFSATAFCSSSISSVRSTCASVDAVVTTWSEVLAGASSVCTSNT